MLKPSFPLASFPHLRSKATAPQLTIFLRCATCSCSLGMKHLKNSLNQRECPPTIIVVASCAADQCANSSMDAWPLRISGLLPALKCPLSATTLPLSVTRLRSSKSRMGPAGTF